jgi:hypothetical protein
MQAILTKTWAQFVTFMHDVPFIHYGFALNEGIWIHLIGSAILAKIIRIKFSYWITVIFVVLIAIAWEALEIYIETPTMESVLAIYGTFDRYLYDTAGDIVGALVMALIVNWYPKDELFKVFKK